MKPKAHILPVIVLAQFCCTSLWFAGNAVMSDLVVVADSPLFSTLVARNAPAGSRGTALTIVNPVGFAITIISIQLLNLLNELYNSIFLFMILAPGPILGLLAMFRKKSGSNHSVNSASIK